MLERMFYCVTVQSAIGPGLATPRDSHASRRNIRAVVGVSRDMQTPFRPVAYAVARSAAMVALAVLLILVLLPAAIAAQAAAPV